jgi:glycosyltransferase involved in cell wall biosynthesis
MSGRGWQVDLSLTIAHVSYSLEVGGAEVLIAQLCRQFRERGQRVEVHALMKDGPVGDGLRQEGIPVLLHGPRSRWHVTRSLVEAFRRSRPDVVHCHNRMATNWAAPAARWAGVPVIVSTRHGLVPPPFDFRPEVEFSLASRLCRAVAGVCQATTDNLARAPFASRRRLVTVYNGAAPAACAAVPPNLSKHGFTLVYVGRLAWPKDVPTLLHALAKVRESGKDVSLWIVGDGKLRAPAERLSADLGLTDAVTFWGERKCPGDFLAAADAFVLSSSGEGLPISLLEAMAAGLPVVTSAIGAMPEVVNGGGGGFVVPAGSVEGFARAIERLAGDPALRSVMGEAGHAHYLAHFTPERMADRYLELYRTGK